MADGQHIFTGPFMLKQAIERGITRAQVRFGPYAKLAHGTYLPVHDASEPLSLVGRAAAALIHCPAGSAISHHTAGRLFGLQLPPDQRIHVAVPGEAHRSRRVGIAAHRLAANHQIIDRGGLPCTSALATLADLATMLRLPDLVAAVDSALARRLATVEELRRYAAGRSRSGSRVLRQAVEMADAGSESAMESRTRVLVRLAGYPAPRCQLPVYGASGQGYFIDMGFDHWQVGLEYDGRHHAENSHQYAWDQRRREDITLTNWRLVTAVSDDIYVHPAAFLDRVDATVRAAGGTPPVRQFGWSAYFGRG